MIEIKPYPLLYTFLDTLFEPRVRALKPPAGTTTLFFAVDKDGKQVPLSLVGEGRVGDRHFSNLRLL